MFNKGAKMDEGQIRAVIKTTKEDQHKLLKYYAKQPWSIRIEIMEFRRKVFHMLKERFEGISYAVLDDAALVLSTQTSYVKEENLRKLTLDDMTLEQIQDLSLISMKQFEDKLPTTSPKKDKLVTYWSIVKLFHSNSKSVNHLRMFLESKKGLTVSNTLILDTFYELEGQKWSA